MIPSVMFRFCATFFSWRGGGTPVGTVPDVSPALGLLLGGADVPGGRGARLMQLLVTAVLCKQQHGMLHKQIQQNGFNSSSSNNK